MKILWLCNMMIPLMSEELGEKVSAMGGWMDRMSRFFDGSSGTELIIVFPQCIKNETISGQTGKGTYYYGYFRGEKEKDTQLSDTRVNQIKDIFKNIINISNPEVIHIWGSELRHTDIMAHAAAELGVSDRVVVSLQGMISYIAQNYYSNLPENAVKARTLRNIIFRDSIKRLKKDMLRRSEWEKDALRNIRHAIGRTHWDKACVKLINKDIEYHHCDEVMRESFFNGRWDPGNMSGHKIFLSRGDTPIKGLHMAIEGLRIVKERYPDAGMFVAGDDITDNKSSLRKRLSYTTYGKYINKLLKEYDLKEAVHFIGYISEEEMKKMFLDSSVFLMASSIENSPNSVCEAMLLGVPVVAADVGGVSSLISHGVNGLIYPYDEPYIMAHYIMTCFEDENMVSSLSENSVTDAKKRHDLNDNVNTLIDIYETIRGES